MIIVQKLIEQGADPAALLAKLGQEPVKVEIVKAEYGAGDTSKDVTDALQQRVGALPLIALDASFNKSFGGDPAPGATKQLTVSYRINGKVGKVAFPENAVIVLPIPQ
jgi:hypothetical protein